MTELRVYRVDGMSCEGCVRAISITIRKSSPDAFIAVDLSMGAVSVAGAASDDAVRDAVEAAGFTYKGAI